MGKLARRQHGDRIERQTKFDTQRHFLWDNRSSSVMTTSSDSHILIGVDVDLAGWLAGWWVLCLVNELLWQTVGLISTIDLASQQYTLDHRFCLFLSFDKFCSCLNVIRAQEALQSCRRCLVLINIHFEFKRLNSQLSTGNCKSNPGYMGWISKCSLPKVTTVILVGRKISNPARYF